MKKVRMSLTEREANIIRDLRLVEKAHGTANAVAFAADDEIIELTNSMVQMAKQAQACSFDGHLFGLVVKIPNSPRLRAEQYPSVVGLLSRWYTNPNMELPFDDGDDVDMGAEG